MTLQELYRGYLARREYLRAGEGARSLADALDEAGFAREAFLLDHHARHGTVPTLLQVAGDPFSGRRVQCGSREPAGAQAGELWFDVCELSAMVLVPNRPPDADWAPDAVARWTPERGWLSLRPVSGWQLAAFLGQPIDAQREAAPVTGVRADEAERCAAWLGKSLPQQVMWQCAEALFPGALEALWGTPLREWAGWFGEDRRIAVSLPTIARDLGDEADGMEPPRPDLRMLFDEHETSPEIGFRTAVDAAVGLFAVSGSVPR